MTQANGADLSGYYEKVRQNGHLLTDAATRQWTEAVLRTLGLNLSRKTKKELGNTLPEELAGYLKRTFWLLHFRDSSISSEEFLKDIARRSGNSDPDFARVPTKAIFHELKAFAGADVSNDVSENLAPELSDFWQQA